MTKIISETEWSYGNGNGTCKIRIETDQNVTSDDIEEQFKSTLRGCGYIIKNE